MPTPYCLGDIKVDEGLRLTPYPDPLSPLAVAIREGKPTAGLSGAPWTDGYGNTKGVTPARRSPWRRPRISWRPMWPMCRRASTGRFPGGAR